MFINETNIRFKAVTTSFNAKHSIFNQKIRFNNDILLILDLKTLIKAKIVHQIRIYMVQTL